LFSVAQPASSPYTLPENRLIVPFPVDFTDNNRILNREIRESSKLV